jgi:hypothetical protein
MDTPTSNIPEDPTLVCRCNRTISLKVMLPFAGNVVICPDCGKAYHRGDFKGKIQC